MKITPSMGFAVIAGLVLLWLVLFRPNGYSLHATKRVACLSNMKQTALDCIMYAGDSDERFPASGSWMDELKPYVRDEGIFNCPELAHNGVVSGYGYAFNEFLAGARMDKLADAAKEPLLYETEQLGRSVWGFMVDMPFPGRHSGGNNFAMADAHMKWQKIR